MIIIWNTICVINLDTGIKCTNETAHDNPIYTIQYSKDGKLLVTSSGDKTIKIWDSQSLGLICTIDTSTTEDFYNVMFSNDGKYVLSSGEGGSYVWDVNSGCLILALRTDIDNPFFTTTSNVYSTAFFDPEGKNIIWRNDIKDKLNGKSNAAILHAQPFPTLQQLIDETRERFKNRKLTPEERRKYYLE